MVKLGVKDALKILEQIKNGEWSAGNLDDQDYYRPYTVNRGGLELWVANGMFSYKLRGLADFTLAAKIVLHFGGLNRFVKQIQTLGCQRAKDNVCNELYRSRK